MNVLIHGFNVKDPTSTVGRLIPYLKNTFMFNYGWFGIFSVLFYNKREAKKLKKLGMQGTYWAHSNGCAIAVRAAKYGLEIETLVCINPALKRDLIFPKSIKNIIVIYTKHDKPTRAAAFFDKVPFIQLLVPNAWGAMGAKGPKDPRAKKMDLSAYLEGHSDFFQESEMEWSVPEIQAIIDKLPK